MITYLLDTSIIVDFYRPKYTYKSRAELNHSKQLRTTITAQKLSNEAILFVPSFCIAEVKNTLAKWFYRKNKLVRKEDYICCVHTFCNQIANRKFFYSYDLNRYHNINCDDIVHIEHTTDTEFMASGLDKYASETEIETKLRQINPRDRIGLHYLSTFDILIISMGVELKRTRGSEIYLITKDKRLALIANSKPNFPKAFYWPDLTVDALNRL